MDPMEPLGRGSLQFYRSPSCCTCSRREEWYVDMEIQVNCMGFARWECEMCSETMSWRRYLQWRIDHGPPVEGEDPPFTGLGSSASSEEFSESDGDMVQETAVAIPVSAHLAAAASACLV